MGVLYLYTCGRRRTEEDRAKAQEDLAHRQWLEEQAATHPPTHTHARTTVGRNRASKRKEVIKSSQSEGGGWCQARKMQEAKVAKKAALLGGGDGGMSDAAAYRPAEGSSPTPNLPYLCSVVNPHVTSGTNCSLTGCLDSLIECGAQASPPLFFRIYFLERLFLGDAIFGCVF